MHTLQNEGPEWASGAYPATPKDGVCPKGAKAGSAPRSFQTGIRVRGARIGAPAGAAWLLLRARVGSLLFAAQSIRARSGPRRRARMRASSPRRVGTNVVLGRRGATGRGRNASNRPNKEPRKTQTAKLGHPPQRHQMEPLSVTRPAPRPACTATSCRCGAAAAGTSAVYSAAGCSCAPSSASSRAATEATCPLRAPSRRL